MTLCTECKTKILTLPARLKRVNEALHTVGRQYWTLLGDAMREIDTSLSFHGFADMANGTEETGTEHSTHMNVGEGKWLHISWHRMDSGRYKVVAYVN